MADVVSDESRPATGGSAPRTPPEIPPPASPGGAPDLVDCEGQRPGPLAVLRSTVLLVTVASLLRLVGFKRLYRRIAGKAERLAALRAEELDGDVVREEDSLAEARHLARELMIVNRRLLPYEANCLVESLAIWWRLSKRGIAADFRLGVRTKFAPLESHAWVELEGAPLNDDQDVGDIFETFDLTVISSPPASR